MNWRELLFWKKPAHSNPAPRLEIGETTPLDGDQSVVDGLREAGSDLSKPREVLHYFYFPDQEKAKSAAAELRQEGSSVDEPIRTTADRSANRWRVLAEINAVVSISSAQETSNRFRALTSRHGGEYDGWAAAATP
jgi:hypothetical protein